MSSFKIYFGKDDIRRIRSSTCEPCLEELRALLLKNYKAQYHPELAIQYDDDEGDRITVTTEDELRYMYSLFPGAALLKIYVVDAPGHASGTYFKDGPPPETVGFYHHSGPSNAGDEEGAQAGEDGGVHRCTSIPPPSLAANVTRCLEHLFPHGRILPHHIPEWLQHACTTRTLDGGARGAIDLDVNIPGLYRLLHANALDHLNKENFAQANVCLSALLLLAPNDRVAHYNMACVHALQHRLDLALAHLEAAVHHGYQNVQHMMEDRDLHALRDHPRYIKLCEEMMEQDVIIHGTSKEEGESFVMVEKHEDEVEKHEDDVEKHEEVIEEKHEEVIEEKHEEVIEEKHEEVIAEKPTPKPSPSELFLKRRYPRQLSTLQSMGFDEIDMDVLATLLKKYKGNVASVIEHLL